jgi:hypothetical protein
MPSGGQAELVSWWRSFTKSSKQGQSRRVLFAMRQHTIPDLTPELIQPCETVSTAPDHAGIFGTALATSVQRANVAISLTDEHGASFVYGYVPVVVAKCGVYLKENGKQSLHDTRVLD